MIEIGISPTAISIGPITIGWYGIMVDLAVIAILLWLMREVKLGLGLTMDTVITAAIVGIPSGVIFSRFLHILDHWGYYSQNLNQLVGGEGLTIWGAVLGATLGMWVYSRVAHFNYGIFTDAIAPAVVLGQSLGRLGCTINGCCYGVATTLPWGIRYTSPDSFGFNDSMVLPAGIGLHPVPVYEILFLLAAFGVLMKLRGRFKPDGSLFIIYLTLYALWRLLADFLRDGVSFFMGLHEAQTISLAILVITIPFIILKVRPAKKEPAPAVESPVTEEVKQP